MCACVCVWPCVRAQGGYGAWVRGDLPTVEDGEEVGYVSDDDDTGAGSGGKALVSAGLGRLFGRQ